MQHHYSRRKRKACATIISWLLIAALLITPIGCADGDGDGDVDQSVGDAGFGSAAWIVEVIASGIISYATGESAGWLLSFVGGDNTDQAFVDAVDQMNQKLNLVIAELAEIEQELEAVMKLIQISTDEIKNIEQQFEIAEPQNIINNTYDNMQNVFTADKIGTQAGKKASQDTTNDILSTGRTNIDQQMYDIHAGIMGSTPGIGNGAMDAFTTTLVDHTGDGQLLNRYKALETYFERLTVVQAKGLSLLVEALHARDNPQAGTGGVSPMDFEGTAKQWMDTKFTPWMEDEVEEFLRCTARLVVAECDLRTDAGAIGPFLPDDAAEIFKRADFIAAQIAPARHPFGAVVRLIGEPDTVKSLIADYQVRANGQVMEVVKLGLDKKDVKETTVEVWNHWPSGWTRAYMQWNWDTYSAHNISGFIRFNAATTVAVAKVCLPTAADSTTYEVNTSFPHETAIGSLNTCECDGDMSCVPAASAADSDETHIYGHATLAIRHRPHGWYYTHDEGHDDRIDITYDHSNLNDNPPWVRARGKLNENIHWHNSEAYFYIDSTIEFPVVNGMNEQRKVSARVYMSGHYYVDNSVDVKDDENKLDAGWIYGDIESHQWTPTKGDNINYSEQSLDHYFDAGTSQTFHIWAGLHVHCKGSEGGEIGLRIWPRHLYLFF